MTLLAGCGGDRAVLRSVDGAPPVGPTSGALPPRIPSAAATPDPDASVTTFAVVLSERSEKHLRKRDIRFDIVDRATANPRVSPERAGGRNVVPEGRELEAWEVVLARVTSEFPCKVLPGEGCRKEIDGRLAYLVVRHFFGPELPHSQPCCNPPPFSSEPIRFIRFAVVDATTGKFLYGGN